MNTATLTRPTAPKTAAEAPEVQAAQKHLADLRAKLQKLDAKIQKTPYQDMPLRPDGRRDKTLREELGEQRFGLVKDVEAAGGKVQQAQTQATARLAADCRPEYLALTRKLRDAAEALGKLLDAEADFVRARGLAAAIGARADWPQGGLYQSHDGYSPRLLKSYIDKLSGILTSASAEDMETE